MTNCLIFLLMGLLGGLLVNYLSVVLPQYRRFAYPVCRQCHANHPPATYIFYKKCPSCGRPRSFFEIFIQIFFPFVIVILGLYPVYRFPIFYVFLLVVYFSVVLIIDVKYQVVLFEMIIPGIILGTIIGLQQYSIKAVILGGFTGTILMLLIYYLGIAFLKLLSILKKSNLPATAIGMGDVYLSFILGLFVGFPNIFLVILTAIFLSGISSGLYILIANIFSKYKPLTTFPYAPFLIISTMIMLII